MTDTISDSRPTNRAGRRATKREMQERYRALLRIAAEHNPASVRHIFYLAVVAGVAGITKNESGYTKVQRALVELRRSGELPYGWIVDNTRWMRRPTSYRDAASCLTEIARLYRRDLWSDADEQVEVWCESDSIAGVIGEITYRWNVPLYVTRGFTSLSFAHGAVEAWNDDGRDVVVYYVGDHDPAGLAIEDKLQAYVDDWDPEVDVHWERLAVTWDQVVDLDLPGTAPKNEYGYELAVEAEALPPGVLRDLLDDAIGSHVAPQHLEFHELIEAEERAGLEALARKGVS
ncbi:MAG: hypothetical protein AAGF73_09020 [Actinomycetota bacterium]